MSILISGFSNSIQQLAQGDPQTSRLIHDNKDAWEVFRLAIQSTAPKFRPFVSDDESEDLPRDRDGSELLANGQPFYLTDMKQHMKKYSSCYVV
jgi:hypothetical protein